jgi:hypothetical protein
MVRFRGLRTKSSVPFLRTATVALSLSFAVFPLAPQECPAVIEPSSHNDPPLLMISVSNPEIAFWDDQQVTVTLSLPVEHYGDYLWVVVSCKTEDNLRFSDYTRKLVRYTSKAWVLKIRLPGFTGRGGRCDVGAALNNIGDLGFSQAELQPQAAAQFRLLDGSNPGKASPKSDGENVEFTELGKELWENHDPALNSNAIKDLHRASEGIRNAVLQIHDRICSGTISERDLWNEQQGALTIIQRARENLLKDSADQPPSQLQRIEVFTHDLEQRLLELQLTDPHHKTGTVRERPAAFHPSTVSDLSETWRKVAYALLHEIETIWDALTDAENTRLLYVGLKITSCPTHLKVEYNAKGYSPDTDRTDTILNFTKARIHFKLSDPAKKRDIEFDRDFFAQPQRRVSVWCDDPNADVWYVE